MLEAWGEAPFYSERERAALALTEAVTRITEGQFPKPLKISGGSPPLDDFPWFPLSLVPSPARFLFPGTAEQLRQRRPPRQPAHAQPQSRIKCRPRFSRRIKHRSILVLGPVARLLVVPVRPCQDLGVV